MSQKQSGAGNPTSGVVPSFGWSPWAGVSLTYCESNLLSKNFMPLWKRRRRVPPPGRQSGVPGCTLLDSSRDPLADVVDEPLRRLVAVAYPGNEFLDGRAIYVVKAEYVLGSDRGA